MTVGELIEELNKYPKDLDVVVSWTHDQIRCIRRAEGTYAADDDEYNYDFVVIEFEGN